MLQFPKKPLLALSVTTAITLSTAAKGNYFSSEERVSFNSPIVDVVEYSDEEGLKNLLRLGVNPNESGDFGTTALIRAAYHGDSELTETLLQAGANPDLSDIGGATALHIAAREGHSSVVELLAIYGANINIQDKEGNTPLMRASANGHTETTEVLTIAGASVNEVNDHGESALLYAANSNSAEIVDTLLQEGADQTLRDEDGLNVRQIAQQKGNEMMVASISKVTGNHIDLIMDKPSNPPVQVAYKSQPAIESKKALAKLEVENKIKFASASVEKPRTDWLNGLKQVFAAAGAFELASVKNYQEGTKYILLDLGKFTNQSFAENKLNKLKNEHGSVFKDLGLAIIEKGSSSNPTYHVNAGILSDKDEAMSICKRLVTAGVNCRPVESTLITAEQFEKFNVFASSKTASSAQPAKIASVETKELEPVLSAEEKFKELKEVVIARATPKAEPIEIPRIEDEVKAVKVTPKLEAKVEAEPVPKIEESMQRDFFSIIEESKKEEKPAEVKEVVMAKPKASVIEKKVETKVEEKAAPPVAPIFIKPIEVKMPAEISKPVEEKKPEIKVARKEVVLKEPEANLLEIAGMKTSEEVEKGNSQEELDNLIDEIVSKEEKPEVKVVNVAPKVKPRKEIKALPPLQVQETPKVQERIDNLASLKELDKPAREYEVARVENVKVESSSTPLPRVRVASRPAVPLVEEPKPEIKEVKLPPRQGDAITDFIRPAEPKAESSDKFRVSQPIRVDSAPVATTSSTEVRTIERSRAAPLTITPNKVSTFQRYSNMQEKWVQIDYFETDDVAGAYWSNVYVNANLPSDMTMSSIKLFHTNEIYYSAFIGPFNNKMAAEGFCDEYAPDGTKCRISKRPINPSYNDFSFKATSPGIKGRHSGGRSRGGFLGNTNNPSLTSQANDVLRNSAMISGKWTLQLGTYNSSSAARAAWDSMRSKSSKLNKLDHNVVKSSSKNKFRLRAGTFNSKADADYYCDKVKSRAVDCIIVQGS